MIADKEGVLSMSKSLFAIAAALMIGGPNLLVAQDDVRTVQLSLAAGASGATRSDTITGYESVLYQLGAEAGQRMTIRLEPSNLATYFNVYGPGSGPGDAAIANASLTGELVPDLNVFDATLTQSGLYTVSVYMMRNAARRDEVSNYTISFGIDGEPGDVVEGDFADGLQGGPDFYRVTTTGGGLNLRAGPSAGAAVVTQLANGQNVRNLGCRMAEGRRWCRVAMLADPGFEGWAAGDFLSEGTNDPSAVASAAAPSNAVSGDTTSTVRVRFQAGTSGAELTGSLAPGESRRYILGASNGQFLYVRVAAQGPGMSYQIFNPDNSFLLDQMTSDQEYRGQLWQSGDHVIEVINRGSSTASYNVIFGID